jgi:hypothetical protein
VDESVTRLHLRTPDIEWTNVDGEVVALDERASVYLAANEAGGLLWNALAEGATRGELSRALAAAYGLSAERAAADTDAFLAQMRAHGLLTES